MIDKTSSDFAVMSPVNLLFKHGGPAVVSMLFMAFYQIIDGMIVGRKLGAEALASVNILYPVIALLSGLAVLIGVGGNTRIAILLGAGKTEKANRFLGLVMSIATVIGVFLSLITLLGMPLIMNILGSSGEMGIFATDYLRQLLPFFTPMVFMFILSQSVRNDGQAVLSSLVMAGSAITNILLDWFFLFILDMGIEGAALATGISQTAGAFVFLVYFLHKKTSKKPGLYIGRPEFKLKWLLVITFNGSSEFFNSLAVGVTTFLLNRMILFYVGSSGVAAFTIVQFLLMIGMAFVMGIGNGLQPAISFNFGAKCFDRVRSISLTAAFASTFTGIIIFIVMSFQTAPLFTLFLPEDFAAITLAAEIAKYVKWSAIFMPLAMFGSIFFTAIEQAGKSLFIAIVRSLLFPAIILSFLPAQIGSIGIWLTPLLSEMLTATIVIFSAATYVEIYKKAACID